MSRSRALIGAAEPIQAVIDGANRTTDAQLAKIPSDALPVWLSATQDEVIPTLKVLVQIRDSARADDKDRIQASRVLLDFASATYRIGKTSKGGEDGLMRRVERITERVTTEG